MTARSRTFVASLLLLAASVAVLGCVSELGGVSETAGDVDAAEEALLFGAVVTPIVTPRPVDRVIVRPPSERIPAGCDRSRRIGVLANGFVCPAATGGWVGRPLFATPTSNSDHRSYVVSPWGSGFCLYEHVGGSYSPSGLPYERSASFDDVNPGRPPSEWLEPDCPVVAALSPAEDLATEIADEYEAAYRAQMGARTSYPAHGVPVEIALLDSSPDSGLSTIEPTLDPLFPHGRAVGNAIRSIAFPEGQPASSRVPHFHSWRALRSDRRAYIGELAEMIETAVRNRLPGTGGRLVLNLSLGFAPTFGLEVTGDDVANYREHALAVMSALNFATCRGALAIVAAGNTEQGPSPDPRPMYPAAFAESTAWTCSRTPTTRAGVPIVYPASGIDGLDRDLPNGRAQGRAPLVAPAFAVTTRDDAGPLPVMTGSSFAAAGVTAVAALVWGYHPRATPQDVMRIVRESAIELRPEQRAHFCHGSSSSCGVARRVSACTAVRGALQESCRFGTSASCDALAAYPRCSVAAAGLVSIPADAAAQYASRLAPELVAAGSGGAQCGGDWYGEPSQPLAPDTMCPHALYTNGLHIDQHGPQPGSDPCEVCAITRDRDDTLGLVIGLDPAWGSTIVSGAVSVGSSSVALPSSVLGASQGSLTSVPLPVTSTSTAVPYLTLKTQQSQVVVVPLPVWSGTGEP